MVPLLMLTLVIHSLKQRVSKMRYPNNYFLLLLVSFDLFAKSLPGFSQEFGQLFEKHSGYSLIKQLTLADKVKKLAWSVNTRDQTITFTGKMRTKIQLIGTESYKSKTWLWAWANKTPGLSSKIKTKAEELKAYGKKHNINFLKLPSFKLDKVTAYQLCLIASGLLHSASFYRAPYQDGAAYFLLTEYPQLETLNKTSPRIMRAVAQLTHHLSFNRHFNHRRAIENMIKQLKMKYKITTKKLIIKVDGTHKISLRFNKKNQLKLMNLISTKNNSENIKTIDNE